MKIHLFAIGCLLICKTYAQHKNEIGIYVQLENMTGSTEDLGHYSSVKYHPVLNVLWGGSYTRAITKKFAVSIEMNYRKVKNEFIIPTSDGTNLSYYRSTMGNETFVTLPILFKFTSRIINFSAGPSIDYFVKWEQAKNTYGSFQQSQFQDSYFPKRYSMGILTRLSKSIVVYKRLLIEPSVYFNPITSFKRDYYGFSLATKFKF